MTRKHKAVIHTAALIAVMPFVASAQAQQYVISTYAGGAAAPVKPIAALQASLTKPAVAMAADTNGTLYFTNGDAVFSLGAGGNITRIAGTGTPGFSGDGGPATEARLAISFGGQIYGQGLVVDRTGNVFIGDIGNHRVRRVSPDGVIATIAGIGTPGSSGDNGPATDAQLGQPSGLAIDRDGNLLIADLNYNVIRKVSPGGIITTLAGIASLNPGFEGDGGPATAAKFAVPWTIAVDLNGNLFIADSNNHRVRKVGTDGIITTVAGNGTTGQLPGQGGGSSGPGLSIAVSFPSGLAVDDRGNLFIADGTTPAVRKLTPDGMLTPVAGTGVSGFSGDGGPASRAQISSVWSVALDRFNNMFISDVANQRIRQIVTAGTITTVAGGGAADLTANDGDGPAAAAQLKLAASGLFIQSGLATDRDGNLFFAETASGLVRKVSTDGTITTVAGGGSCISATECPLGDDGPARNAHLKYPRGVAVDAKGDIFIADFGNWRVRKVSADGIITTVAGNGVGGSSGDGGPAIAAQVVPQGIAVDGAGNLLIAEGTAGHVRKVSVDGTITTIAGGGDCAGPTCDGHSATDVFMSPAAIALDESGNLLIADNAGDDVNCYYFLLKVTPDGTVHTLAGQTNSCYAGSGDGGPAMAAALNFTSSVTVDSVGNIFLTDVYGNRIRRISTDGIITTVAGPRYGYSGDGGVATSAALLYPMAVAADAAGNVFLSDGYNQAVRVLRPMIHPTLSAVVDAASQQPGPLSPGKIVVLYGAGLGPSTLIQNQPADLPVGKGFGPTIGGTAVTFNSISAPVLYASSGQVAAVVPYGISGTAAQVQVTYRGDTSNLLTLPVAAAAPNLFTLNQAGSGQTAAINVSNGKPNTALNPVKIGGYVMLYATGEGQSDPPGVDGKLIDSSSIHQLQKVKVFIDGIPAFVQYAGGAPGLVAGAMQVNVQIPEGVRPGGYVPVVLQVGDQKSGPTVWVAVSAN